MKRRHFLGLSGMLSGACLVPAAIIHRIHEAAVSGAGPRLIAPQNAPTILYAVDDGGYYTLHLGDPDEEPDYPTLEEFIEDRGFNPRDPESLRQYLVEWCGLDGDDTETIAFELEGHQTRLSAPIQDGEIQHWMDWDYELREGTMPKAFYYLAQLPLINGTGRSGLCIGDLSFIEGDRPGSNLCYCTADDLQSLTALQHRLNELGEGVRIQVD